MRGYASIAVASVWLVLSVVPAVAQVESLQAPSLFPGAIEVGGMGSLTTVEGVASGAFGLRAGMFFFAPLGLLEAEVGTSYRHVSSRNIFDAELAASWQLRLRASGTYPFVSVGGGVRHEEVGSFGATRYPLGVGVGARALLSPRVAVRAEYQYRRVLNDPVSDFNEHQVLLGLSVFFRNRLVH